MRPVVAEVVRSGFVEGRHHGTLLAVDADGATVVAIGPVDEPVFPRSVNKPLQAVGCLTAGARLDDDRLVAVAAASHAGNEAAVGAVRALLHGAGLTESQLDNVPGLPLDETAAHHLLRAGGGPDSLHQNCSGKHALMLATCVAAGWPTAGYRDPAHPLQQHIRRTIEALTDEPVAATGVDGCGAPLFALSPRALARGFGRLVTAAPGSAERRVADAMRSHTPLVGGPGRAVTLLMEAVPGLLAKDGAEGVFAAALPSGAAAAVKIDDGAARAAAPVLVAGLRRLGVPAEALAALATAPVLGHDDVVGEVRPVAG